MLRGPGRRYARPNFVGRCEPWLADYSFFADLAGFTAAFATKSSSPTPNTVVLGPSARSDQDYESALSERALEQPHDASVGADVDIVGRRHLGQAGHGHDIAAYRDHELRAG